MCSSYVAKLITIISLFIILFTWAGCGGGGGGDGGDPSGEATLTVVSSSPSNGASGVARDVQVVITFSQPINPATLNDTTVTLSTGGTAIPSALTLDGAGSGLTISPSFPLGAGAPCTVTVTTGLKDREGNFLASDYALSFTTAAAPALGQWTKVSAGRDNGMALNENGTVWEWGCNVDGQIGNGEKGGNGDPAQDPVAKHSLDVHSPVQAGINPDWEYISSGNHISFAIMNNGMLFAWGAGFLGNGDKESVTPVRVGTDSDWAVVESSAITQFTCATKTNGTLWEWGSNLYGQIGNGQIGNQVSVPTLVNNDTWSMVAAGGAHVAAIRADGTLWAWGSNQYGQLGNGTNGTRVVTDNQVQYLTDNNVDAPVRIGGDSDWAFVAAKGTFTLAIKRDGSLWAWGSNDYGQLGLGMVSEVVNTPTRVGAAMDWESAAPGANHTVAIKRNGTLWTWGGNGSGQLGDSTGVSSRSTPAQVGTDINWRSASSGEFFTVALRDDGTLWTWGKGEYYRLGDGSQANRNFPKQL